VNDNENLTIPFGLFELDAAGTVIYYSPSTEEHRDALRVEMIGRNFFSRLASISEVEELKSRFLRFMASGTSFERFTVSFPYKQESVKVQIVMAHVSEKTEQGRERFALLRVMPETHPIASSLVNA
jgi:photoactive yellow protein